MISFTDKAIDRFKEVVEAPDCVRVAVVGGGCAGNVLYARRHKRGR